MGAPRMTGYPQLNPRHKAVSKARFAIADAISAAVKEHDLNLLEITSILAGEIQSWCNSAYRAEREEEQERPE